MGIFDSIGTGATIAITIKAIDEFSDSFKKAEGGLAGITAGLSSLAGPAIVAGIAAVGKALFDFGKASVMVADNLEQTKIAFTTMLGSAEKADAFIRDMIEFARKTPFELAGLEKAAKTLLAYGIEQKDVLKDLEILGNIAAGVGMEKLPNLILAFGQVSAATRLTGMELRQFTEAGVPLLDELAKELNVTVAEVKEMVSAGQIGFPLVQKALSNLTDEGGRFHNLMANQMKSFGGIVSNVKDAIMLLQNEIGKAFLPGLKEMATILLEKVFPAAQPLINIFKDVGAMLIDIANKGINNLLPTFKTISELFGKFWEMIKPILPSLGELINNFIRLSGTILQNLAPSFELFMNIMKPLVPVLQVIIDALNFFIGLVNKILGAFNSANVNNPFIQILKTIADLIGKIIGGAAEMLGGAFKSLAKLFGVDMPSVGTPEKVTIPTTPLQTTTPITTTIPTTIPTTTPTSISSEPAIGSTNRLGQIYLGNNVWKSASADEPSTPSEATIRSRERKEQEARDLANGIISGHPATMEKAMEMGKTYYVRRNESGGLDTINFTPPSTTPVIADEYVTIQGVRRKVGSIFKVGSMDYIAGRPAPLGDWVYKGGTFWAEEGGAGGLRIAHPYNDFIMSPKGEIIQPSKEDWIMGIKGDNIPDMGGKITVYIDKVYGVDAEDISDALQRRLNNLIRR